MYLQQILNGLCYTTIGKGNPNVEHLSFSTTDVKPNTLFFCLKGKRFDGHDFFAKAVCDGAVAIVTEKPLDSKVLQIVVEDSRLAMAVASKNFFDRCVEKMQVVSVVGTNGKTSTTYVLDAILQKAGYNTAVVGTNGIFFNGQKHANQLTTPDPICLHGWFKQMYLCKVNVVIMEVSAHAIALNKMQGITSDFAIFTNFSQDHLDFFGTMEQYKKAKASFFCKQQVNNCVVNVDDNLGQEIAQNCPNTIALPPTSNFTQTEATFCCTCLAKLCLFPQGCKAPSTCTTFLLRHLAQAQWVLTFKQLLKVWKAWNASTVATKLLCATTARE